MYTVIIIRKSDITKLDTRLLLAFIAIFEEGNVTRAAKRVNLSQQGLSGVLVRLRELFDDPLFVRTSHGVNPTPTASSLYPKVMAALESLQKVLQDAPFNASEIDTTFRLATNDYALSVVVQPLFKKLRKIAPRLKLAVVPLSIDLLAEQMRNGQVDLALSIPEFISDKLNASVLFSDHYKCVFRKGHTLEKEEITLELFCNTEHLLVAPNGNNLTGPTDIALAQAGYSRTVSVSVPSFLMAEPLLVNNNLLAMLPSRLLKNFSERLIVRDPPIQIPSFDIVCVWPDRVDSEPVNIWFRELLRVWVGDR